LSRILEGLSEAANKGKIIDQHFVHEKFNNQFVEVIVDIALNATQIPLSIFKNKFHQRFEKKSMLESMLEILQQFYIQMESEPDDLYHFPGDLSTYTLRCKRCSKCVTLHGSIGETQFLAPAAMLYHWNMIEPHDEQIHREPMFMTLLFTSYEIFL
jgi:hypothetical protein